MVIRSTRKRSNGQQDDGSSQRFVAARSSCARNAERLAENMGAVDVALSADDLRRIGAAFPDGAYGPRYAEASLPAWV